MRSLFLKHFLVVALVLAALFVALVQSMEVGLGVDPEPSHYLVELPVVLVLAALISCLTCCVHRRLRRTSK